MTRKYHSPRPQTNTWPGNATITDQPMAPRERDTELQQCHDSKKNTIKEKQPALCLSQQDDCKT